MAIPQAANDGWRTTSLRGVPQNQHRVMQVAVWSNLSPLCFRNCGNLKNAARAQLPEVDQSDRTLHAVQLGVIAQSASPLEAQVHGIWEDLKATWLSAPGPHDVEVVPDLPPGYQLGERKTPPAKGMDVKVSAVGVGMGTPFQFQVSRSAASKGYVNVDVLDVPPASCNFLVILVECVYRDPQAEPRPGAPPTLQHAAQAAPAAPRHHAPTTVAGAAAARVQQGAPLLEAAPAGPSGSASLLVLHAQHAPGAANFAAAAAAAETAPGPHGSSLGPWGSLGGPGAGDLGDVLGAEWDDSWEVLVPSLNWDMGDAGGCDDAAGDAGAAIAPAADAVPTTSSSIWGLSTPDHQAPHAFAAAPWSPSYSGPPSQALCRGGAAATAACASGLESMPSMARSAALLASDASSPMPLPTAAPARAAPRAMGAPSAGQGTVAARRPAQQPGSLPAARSGGAPRPPRQPAASVGERRPARSPAHSNEKTGIRIKIKIPKAAPWAAAGDAGRRSWATGNGECPAPAAAAEAAAPWQQQQQQAVAAEEAPAGWDSASASDGERGDLGDQKRRWAPNGAAQALAAPATRRRC